MLGMFFLPLGYDFLFKFLLDCTGSYIVTDSIFYITSAVFLIIHLWITKRNIAIELDERISKANIEIIKFKSKF